MKKNIIFSHESDIDGLGCIVLAKLAMDKLDYTLVPNNEKLEQIFRNDIRTKEFEKYNKIYITDLALYDPSLTIVANSPLKDKVKVFDHHKKAIDDNMNRYPFTKIIEEDESEKKCGTKLFYEFLVQNNLLISNNAIEEFVELTRLEDTWEWKKNGSKGEKAHDLAILLSAIGVKKYISTMIAKLQNNSLSFEFTRFNLSYESFEGLNPG